MNLKSGPSGILRMADIMLSASPGNKPIKLVIEGIGTLPIRVIQFEVTSEDSWTMRLRPVGRFRKKRKK